MKRLMKLSVAFAALSLFAALAMAGPAGPRVVKDIVLVHGAFADGSSWSEVTALLQRKGYNVTAVQNPLTGLADDVAATRRVLERKGDSVLLVGHSWAGAVITEAGNAPNVKGLVYLSALVPDSNESVAELLTRQKAPMDGMQPDANGLVWLDDAGAFGKVMAGDVPLAKVQLLAAAQQPMAARAFEEKVTHAAWHDKPSWYLVTENDNALAPRVQRWTVQNIGAKSIALRSSHMSLVSHPKEVAAFIERAAEAAAATP